MKKIGAVAVLIGLLIMACSKTEIEVIPDVMSGGTTTIFAEFSNAFQLPAPNLNADGLQEHRQADAAFEAIFVTAPAEINAGVGPLFNQNSCAACHSKNGRAAFPEIAGDLGGLLFRVSLPGQGMHGEPLAIPGFGTQLQTKATFGKEAEAKVQITYETLEGAFADGEKYALRRPIYNIQQSYLPFPGNALFSPRIAPPVFGLGLLENINEADILKNADEYDRNNDGISGRPNYVWDIQANKKTLGRFGWKANQPNLHQQTAAAYSDDMGVTSPLFPTDPAKGQLQEDSFADDPEISDALVALTAFYTQSLGVPAPRRQEYADIKSGKLLFKNMGCTKCHSPQFTTDLNLDLPFLSNQKIQPYTDLLLHDMGEGLADNRPDFEADGREWRTPPLWGIGLTQVVSGHSNFLHDGRARNLQEAILWHDGEAKSAKESFKKLSKKEREQILYFLSSL